MTTHPLRAATAKDWPTTPNVGKDVEHRGSHPVLRGAENGAMTLETVGQFLNQLELHLL